MTRLSGPVPRTVLAVALLAFAILFAVSATSAPSSVVTEIGTLQAPDQSTVPPPVVEDPVAPSTTEAESPGVTGVVITPSEPQTESIEGLSPCICPPR